MARDFRAGIAAHGFVAKHDSGDFDLVGKMPAAMVGKARVVVADDPGPVEAGGELGQKRPRVGRQPIAAEAVMEAVAEAIEGVRPGPLDHGRERGQRRVQIIGRKELPEAREPARFLEVQIGDQKRVPVGPEQRSVTRREEMFRLRTKREPWAGCNAGYGSS